MVFLFAAVNASYLGKNGAVTYLYKVLITCGRKYLILLKYALDSLSYLVKSSKYETVTSDAFCSKSVAFYAVSRHSKNFLMPAGFESFFFKLVKPCHNQLEPLLSVFANIDSAVAYTYCTW